MEMKGTLINLTIEMKVYMKNLGSARSSSVSDLNNSFERNARKEIQKKLYTAFGLGFIYINFFEKKLDDADIFRRISSFVPNSSALGGQIDVYFAIISPQEWKVVDDRHLKNVWVLDGSFSDSVVSLNAQKKSERFFESPTTPTLPKLFNYYNLFEASTGSDIKYKLDQLETQCQYVITRQMDRDKQKFLALGPEADKMKFYSKFIGEKAIKLIAFCGLIFAKDYVDVKKKLSDLLEENDGLKRPCLYKMFKEKRFLYLKSAMFSERLELLEEQFAITPIHSTLTKE